MASHRIFSTREYGMFTRSPDNRETAAAKRHRLHLSMQKHGFMWCLPMVTYQSPKQPDKKKILDGQHRRDIAEELNLEVHYVVFDKPFDIALVNSTPEKWKPRDYATVYARTGNEHYLEGLRFADQHQVPVSLAFTLLSGTTTFANISSGFMGGRFQVKDRPWANAVLGIYGPMIGMSSHLKNVRFLQARAATCRVAGFDGRRLLSGASRQRDKLVGYSTRDAYLEMIESLYNHGRSRLVPLKTESLMAMRERDPKHRNADSKEAA